MARILNALWRGKWIIGATVLVAALIGIFYAFVWATPTYRSSAVIVLEVDQGNIVDFDDVVSGISGDSTAINTEVEVLRARSLMEKVVDRLNLQDDPEFNRLLRDPGLRDIARGWVMARLGQTTETTPPTRDVVRDITVNGLLSALSVRNVPNSLVFQVTVESQSAQKAALIADTIVENYILNQIEVKFAATEQATSWLTERVAELQIELEDAEAEAAEFNAQTNLVSVESLQLLERQMKDLRDRIVETTDLRNAGEARVAALREATTFEEKAALANDPQLTRLADRAANETQIANAFDTRFGQLINRAETDVARISQQLSALTDTLPELEQQIETQSADLIVLQQLQREAEASRLLYEYFLGRLKETSAQEGIQQADSRILSQSVVPISPHSPKKTLIVVVAAFLGLAAGLVLIALRELARSGFRSASEVEQIIGLPVLGQIPTIKGRKRRQKLTYLADKPMSFAAEAVRNLRTSVLLTNVDAPPQVILSTSSLPGEGKTTNSLALSQNFAAMGKKVLVIEGDIRRRTFGDYFDNLPQKGLVSAISGATELDDAIRSYDTYGFDVLGGETAASSAADLFSSERFNTVMKQLRERYDIIVIDTPPVLVVPDARIIGAHADAILFTVKWDSTDSGQVEEAMRLFRDTNLKISGVVLSQINMKRQKRYGYGQSYGGYGAAGSKYYTN